MTASNVQMRDACGHPAARTRGTAFEGFARIHAEVTVSLRKQLLASSTILSSTLFYLFATIAPTGCTLPTSAFGDAGDGGNGGGSDNGDDQGDSDGAGDAGHAGDSGDAGDAGDSGDAGDAGDAGVRADGGVDAGNAEGLTCVEIADCIGACSGASDPTACSNTCLERGSPSGQETLIAYAKCLNKYSCSGDKSCVETNCAKEVQACVDQSQTGTSSGG
jgi:hypothetical protein